MTVNIKITKKSLSQSSRQWLRRHLNDPFVKRAKVEGYRSRAAYKLLEAQKKFKLIKQDTVIVELGAAPGGWSQVCLEVTKNRVKMIANDLISLDPLPSVDFIQGDFTDPKILTQIQSRLESQKIDLILSDIAPNTSGVKSADQGRIIAIVEDVLAFAKANLAPRGRLLTKLFQGEGFDALLKEYRASFSSIQFFKPESSRKSSCEIYIYAQQLKTPPSIGK